VSPTDPQALISRVARRIAELRRTKGLTQAEMPIEMKERFAIVVQGLGIMKNVRVGIVSFEPERY